LIIFHNEIKPFIFDFGPRGGRRVSIPSAIPRLKLGLTGGDQGERSLKDRWCQMLTNIKMLINVKTSNLIFIVEEGSDEARRRVVSIVSDE
jgi:hypothetical protein